MIIFEENSKNYQNQINKLKTENDEFVKREMKFNSKIEELSLQLQ